MPQTVPPLTTALHHGPLRRPVPKRPRPSILAHAVSLFLENGGHTRASCLPCCSLSPEPSFLLGHKLSTLHVSAREPPRQSRFLQTGPRAPSPCFSPTFAHTTVLGSVFRNWTPCAQSHTLLVGARTSCFASLRLGSTPSVKWGCCCSRLRKAATAENSVGTTRSLPLLIASSLLTLSPRH